MHIPSNQAAEPPITRRQWLLFLLIAAAGVALRIVTLSHLMVVSPDSPGYISNALAIGSEGIKSLFQGGFDGNFSIYPLFIYLVNLVVKDPIVSGQLVSLFFGSLLLLSVFLFTRELMGTRIGLITTLMAALHIHLVRYSGEVLKDSTLVFFALTTLTLTIIGYKRKNHLLIFLAGLAAWTTCLVRIYGIIIIISIAAAMIVSGLMERRGIRRTGIDLMLFIIPAPALGYLVFALTVGIKNEFIIQSLISFIPTITTKLELLKSYDDILLANNPGINPEYLDLITSHHYLTATGEFINVFATAFFGFFMAFFLLGIYLDRTSIIKPGPRRFVLIYAAFFSLLDILIIIIFFFLTKRHVLPLILALLPWSAFAVERIWTTFITWSNNTHGFKRLFLHWAIPLFFFLWIIFAFIYAFSPTRENEKLYYKRLAGEYIKRTGIEAPYILIPCSDRLVVFYAEGQGIEFSATTPLEQVIDESNPDFILWDTDMGSLPESMQELMDRKIIEPITMIPSIYKYEIIIYRNTKK